MVEDVFGVDGRRVILVAGVVSWHGKEFVFYLEELVGVQSLVG